MNKPLCTFVELKRTTSILLIIILSAGFFINIGIYTWFQLEQVYIASELCENRFVEESDCGGHCVLEKKINDVEQKSATLLEFKLLSFTYNETNENLIIPKKGEFSISFVDQFFEYQFLSKNI